MLEQGESSLCPVSSDTVQSKRRDGSDLMYYDCPRCGRFGLTRNAERKLPSTLLDQPDRIALLAHVLRRMQTGSEWPLVDSAMLDRVLATTQLPTVLEQADNLVRWLGEHVKPGDLARVSHFEHGAFIG